MSITIIAIFFLRGMEGRCILISCIICKTEDFLISNTGEANCSTNNRNQLYYKSSYHWQTIIFRTFQAWGDSNVYPPTKLFKPSAQRGCEHKEVTFGFVAGIYFSYYLPSHKFPVESWKLMIENTFGTHWVNSPAHWETPPMHYISLFLSFGSQEGGSS